MRDIASQCSGSAAKVGVVSSSAAVSSPTRSVGREQVRPRHQQIDLLPMGESGRTQGLRPDGDFRFGRVAAFERPGACAGHDRVGHLRQIRQAFGNVRRR